MSDWALGGLLLAMFIAGFNIGQDLKYKKGIFKRNRGYRYYISGAYSVEGHIIVTSWTVKLNEEMTNKMLEKFVEEEKDNLKKKYRTEDVGFTVLNFTRLKD
ncbi:hypothetical protein [Fusobacterium animalis]|uniref:hypothetical protein n=1 Tax=Fusobacterium animalis TaxID=76859 RepID=UPI0030CC1199